MEAKPLKTVLSLLIAACAIFGQEAIASEQKQESSGGDGNLITMQLNGKEWVADGEIFAAFHSPGYNKALIISGTKGPKNKDEEAFNLNLYNVEGPGTYRVVTGNPDKSVAQMGNLSPENFMYGNLMGFDLKVTVTKASSNPTVIEATFEGTLKGNAGDTLQVTEGRVRYRE